MKCALHLVDHDEVVILAEQAEADELFAVGHEMAIRKISARAPIHKYEQVIGVATSGIATS